MDDNLATRPANPAPPAPEFPWPNGARSALFPAFDVDSESVWLGADPQNAKRLITMSYGGYEARVGIPKILELWRRHEVKATFFVTGWSIDAVAMHTWYQHSPRAIDGLSTRADGTGQIVSLEGGYPVRIAPHLTIEPQAQVIYQHLSLDPMRDLVSPVSYGGSDAVSGRIGMRLTGDFQTMSGSILQPYLKANVWRTFGGWDSVTFAGTDLIQTQRMATAMEIGGGIVAKLNDGLGIFASAAFITNLDGARRNTVQANVGLRARW